MNAMLVPDKAALAEGSNLEGLLLETTTQQCTALRLAEQNLPVKP
jgi:hypothetical protein